MSVIIDPEMTVGSEIFDIKQCWLASG